MVESSHPVSPDDVARHYDQLDRFYRDIWGEHVHHGLWRTGRETSAEAARALADEVIALAGIAPGMDVCDVGCGYGATARIIARDPGANVIGLTISPAQQRYAESVTAPGGNPRFLLRDWLDNQLPSAVFDALIAIESTEHMGDKARVFSEAARVLRPGGRMVVCAWLTGEPLKAWHRRRLIEPISREGRMPGIGAEADYRRWIRNAGFEITDCQDISTNVARTWPVCAWRFVAAVLRRPGYLRFLLDRRNDNRIFAATMFRLWLAFRINAMRYVIFTAVKPGEGGPDSALENPGPRAENDQHS